MNGSTETVGNSHFEEAPKREKPAERLMTKGVRYVKTLGHFVRLLIGLLSDSRVDRKVKIFVGAVLAYVAAPVDFIPELFSGLFGMLDDFVLSAFALNVILNWVDPQIVKSHWKGEDDLLVTIQKAVKNAEMLVPDAILKKIQMWIGKQTERAVVLAQANPPAPVIEEEKPKRKRRAAGATKSRKKKSGTP